MIYHHIFSHSLTANWCRIGVTIGVKTVDILIMIPGQSLDTIKYMQNVIAADTPNAETLAAFKEVQPKGWTFYVT